MKNKILPILFTFGLIFAFGFNLVGQEKKEKKKIPQVYLVKFQTTVGDFVVEVHRDWARNGADRFYTLASSGFYDDCRFFRAVPDFMVQFGISGDPEVSAKWITKSIKDDPVLRSNKRGTVTFATSGPDSRTTQVFINTKMAGNTSLDSRGFAPFGQVISGMDVVDRIYSGYGEKTTDKQQLIQLQGNKYLDAEFPKLDGITKATVVLNPN